MSKDLKEFGLKAQNTVDINQAHEFFAGGNTMAMQWGSDAAIIQLTYSKKPSTTADYELKVGLIPLEQVADFISLFKNSLFATSEAGKFRYVSMTHETALGVIQRAEEGGILANDNNTSNAVANYRAVFEVSEPDMMEAVDRQIKSITSLSL